MDTSKKGHFLFQRFWQLDALQNFRAFEAACCAAPVARVATFLFGSTRPGASVVLFTMASIYHKHEFLSSSEIQLDFKVFISHLLSPIAASECWYISARIVSSGLSVGQRATCSSVPHMIAKTAIWHEWLMLPVKFSELQRGDQLVGHAYLHE